MCPVSARVVSNQLIFCCAEVNNFTESDEECLRPSLLKKRHQLSSHSKTPHRENIPWNGQSTTPDHKATRIPVTAYDSPAHQTPFAALFSSCPSTGLRTGTPSSPAEHSLFGNPTPMSLLGALNAIPGANGHASASEHHHAENSHGISKVVMHISRLKKENAHFAQQLKVGAPAFTLALPVLTAICRHLHSQQLIHAPRNVSELQASLYKHAQVCLHSVSIINKYRYVLSDRRNRHFVYPCLIRHAPDVKVYTCTHHARKTSFPYQGPTSKYYINVRYQGPISRHSIKVIYQGKACPVHLPVTGEKHEVLHRSMSTSSSNGSCSSRMKPSCSSAYSS